MHPVLVAIFWLTVLYVVRLALEFRRIARGFGGVPEARQPFSPFGFIAHTLPRIPGIVEGGGPTLILRKYQSFEECGWDASAIVSAWPCPQGFINLADPVAIKEVTMQRARFPKPAKMFEIIDRSIYHWHCRISWTDEPGTISPGHKMTFKDALRSLSDDILIMAFTPRWARDLTHRLRTARQALEELTQYMSEMVVARRMAETKEVQHDLLSSLMDEGGENPLSDIELNGNILLFLLAGHETTAHTLALSLTLLALHQDVRDRLYQQITSVMTDLGRMPTYDEIHLTYPLAIIYEIFRFIPTVNLRILPRHNSPDLL
ncbi:cytochrome P450 [Artomyces pyxidatus]|uniref:Cytochrome P450 n=1 Tax=Artomyces pyxidatus TaxID=48021 RepID=A0ACB8TDX9_9AGAM|nr:cytochrome P450 [Artomyces pyxidatus]